jgi:hypothetical protein
MRKKIVPHDRRRIRPLRPRPRRSTHLSELFRAERRRCIVAKRIYRVVSVCGALGYGYPKESLEEALKGGVDAIISDGGSMDAGPYYLGTGTEYFERDVFGAQQQSPVERLSIPVYAQALAKPAAV